MTQDTIISWVKYWPVLIFIWMAYQAIIDSAHDLSERLAIVESKQDYVIKEIDKMKLKVIYDVKNEAK